MKNWSSASIFPLSKTYHLHPNIQFIETGFEGLFEIIPKVFPDDRGFFFESYRSEWMHAKGIDGSFPQENQSFSKKGVVRGLHFQRAPHSQAKLVRVLQGKVLDVVVDLRRSSTTFCKVFSMVLDSQKQNQLYIPEGFAHGLAALEDSVFFYKCSSLYHPAAETGIRWDDPELKIKWPFDTPIVSGKDKELPTLQQLIRNSVI
jgi:dTDP-4-dehydrorhamnose 3,5-epimerase